MKRHILTLSLSLFLSVIPVFSFDPLKPVKTDSPPAIDGVLDDPLWTRAPSVTGFKTFMPDFGGEMPEKTTVLMAYDSENLYFAYRCHDAEPDKIKTSISSRDNIIPDDWVCINLDSFNDQQALTAFYINPLGIQADSRFSAGNEDFSIDLVWYSAGKLDSSGYTVEIQIPLKSLRYRDSDPVEMSVFFERYISRRSEHGSFPEMDPAKGTAFLTQMNPMIYHGLEHYTLLELLPAVTYSNKSERIGDRLRESENKPDFSLTAKYGISSDLILDGTLNPDFSQVEADAGQVDVNLRYSIYYPEKRPFFLEGSEIFRIGATLASELDPIASIVHTRTVLDPVAGLKLAGKAGADNTLAFLYTLDEIPGSMAEYGNRAHLPLFRFKKALSQDSYMGGIYADREMERRFNRVAGLDEMYRLRNGLMIESHWLMSQTRTSVQQKTDWGHAAGISAWRMTRDLDWGITFKDLSDDFFADMGYVTRTGIFGMTGILRPKVYPQSDIIPRIDAELFTGWTKDKPSGMWETFNHFSVKNYLFGSLQLKWKYSYATEIYLGERYKTGGFHVLAGGQFTKAFALSVLYRRINAVHYDYLIQGKSNQVTASMILQPLDKLSFESSFIFYDFRSSSDNEKIYEYPIFREKLTYQVNKYAFFRAIGEYNRYRKELLADFLASFTYIPGTVVHVGYGSLWSKTIREEHDPGWSEREDFLTTKQGFFFKMSYLWRS